MNIQQLKHDDKAVSPVIGVILMVAITVILAAVIASFVLGLGPDTATTPTATFDSEVTSGGDALVITMESGQSLNPENIEFSYETGQSGTFDNSTVNSVNSVTDIDGETWSASQEYSNDITAGTSATVDFVSGDFTDGESYTVRLVYVEGDTTSTMQTFEGTYDA